MSKFRILILEALTLAESEAKIDFLLKNKNLEDSLRSAIQNDPEVENKSITPKELLLQWDKDSFLSKNISWIAKQYSNNKFYFGDINRVKEDLEKFEKYKKNKNIFDSADLNQYDYSILKQKLNTIDDNDISLLGSSARKNTTEKGKNEIEKFYEDEKWFIIIPKTEAASRYWGKHSHWCTAADSEHNMFNYYNKQGPLYILIDKNDPNEKYQFHFESNQFKDIDNDSIYVPMFLEDNPEIKPLFKNKIDKSDYRNWIWLDENDLSYDECLAAVKQKGSALYYVPEKFKTLELCLAAVKQGGEALKFVPEKFKTEEMCWAAIKNYGRALRYVPGDLKTLELYLAAVEQDSSALQFIPINLITPEMCLEAVKQKGSALQFIPRKFITPEICLEAIKQDGLALYHVPVDLKTPEMCLIAVKQNGDALAGVPEEFKTPEICLEAVKNYGLALQHVPEEFKTPEICLEAVKNYGLALADVPEKFKTPEICLEAVKNYGWALRFVPEKFKTLEICLAAIKHDDGILGLVPEELKAQVQSLIA